MVAGYKLIINGAFAIWITLCGFCLGQRVSSLLKVNFSSLSEQTIFSCGMGLGILSYLVLAIGSLGLLYHRILYLLLICITIFCFKQIIEEVSKLKLSKFNIPRSYSTNSMLIILGVFLLLNMVAALAPPTFSDIIRTQLAAGKYFIKEHKINFIPYFLWPFPFTVEMLYVLAMAVCSDTAAALINTILGILVAIAIYVFSERYMERKVGIISAAVFYTMPIVGAFSSMPKAEMGFALFSFLSLYALVNHFVSKDKKWLIISAILAGFSAGSKIQGLFFLSAITITLFVANIWIKPLSLKDKAASMLLFIAISVAVASPWYIRSWVATGDPFWPFGYPLFHGKYWDEFRYLHFANWNKGRGMGLSFINFIKGPWNLTNHLANFNSIRIPLPPLFLAFLPGLFLVEMSKEKKRIISLLILCCFIFYTQWFYSMQAPQYLFIIWPVLSALTGFVIVRLFDAGGLVKAVAVSALIIVFLFNSGLSIFYNGQFFPVVFGKVSQDEFLSYKVWYYKDIDYINKRLPKGSKVLYFPLESYYLDVDYAWGAPIYSDIDYLNIKTADDYMRLLKKKGITHIFITDIWIKEANQFIRWALKGEDRFNKIFADMEKKGYIIPVYENPEAKIIYSRTLSNTDTDKVVVYKIDYGKFKV